VISKLSQKIGVFWQNRSKLRTHRGVSVVALASFAIASVVLGVRHLGVLEPFELSALDQMVRWRPDRGEDPRLLVVGITEEDIQTQKNWPLPNQVVAEALQKLQQHQPRAIGLDIYRTSLRQAETNCQILPTDPGDAALAKQLQTANTITITNIGSIDENGIPPIPCLPAEQIGFNDVPEDKDDIIRRNLLFASSNEKVLFSFSLRLALLYLEALGIEPEPSKIDDQYMQLGDAVFIWLESNSGSYQALDSGGYQILLNYRSPEKVAPQVSLTDVLEDRIDPSLVKGKIVLIGTTAPSIKDTFSTPYTPVAKKNFKMPGVAIHAHMVSQILDAASGEQPLFWFWPEWAEMLWISGWAIVGGSLAWVIRHPITLGLSGLGTMGTLAGSCLVLFSYQGWIPVVAPAMTLVMTGGAVVAYRAYQSQKQQQTVMRLLGQNTSPEIAAALWKSRDRLLKSGKLPGQKLTATMLFTDIKDFSSISEQMPPEKLLEWLNEFLGAITQEVQLHHGIVNKFTGDGLMAVFGVPVSRSSPEAIAADAQEAVACALAMGDRLRELNQVWQEKGLPAVQMRVGIFTGPVVAGSLGGKERLEYGVIGDSVNIASRLESCEKERQVDFCRVLIARETLVHLHNQFQVEPWGLMSLKGKQQPIDVYRVVCHASEKSPLVFPQPDNVPSLKL